MMIKTPRNHRLFQDLDRQVWPEDLSAFYWPAADRAAIRGPPTSDHEEPSSSSLEDHDDSSSYYIGPVQVGRSTLPGGGRGLLATRDIAAGECLLILPSLLEVDPVQVWQQYRAEKEEEERLSTAAEIPEPTDGQKVQRIAERLLLQQIQEEMLLVTHPSSWSSGDDDDDDSQRQRRRQRRRRYERALSTLLGGSDDPEEVSRRIPTWADLLAVVVVETETEEETWSCKGPGAGEDGIPKKQPSVEHWRQVIRRNAFGPDFCTFQYVESRWSQQLQQQQQQQEAYHDEQQQQQRLQQEKETCDPPDPSKSTPPPAAPEWFMPPRLLGLYPAAAMINHACVPNALRVYPPPPFSATGSSSSSSSPPTSTSTTTTTTTTCTRRTMIIMAGQAISAGQEILWSYIPSATCGLYPQRQQHYLDPLVHVTCTCPRCQAERQAAAWLYPPVDPTDPVKKEIAQALHKTRDFLSNGYLMDLGLLSSSSSSTEEMNLVQHAWEQLDRQVFQQPSSVLSNDLKHHLRMGTFTLHLNYLNNALLRLVQCRERDRSTIQQQLLKVVTSLHLACCVDLMASTEHLSLLHVAYDLAAQLHAGEGGGTDRTLLAVRFWTEQLKRAHMIRYGALGHDVEKVRAMMQHTRSILRQPQGMEKLPYHRRFV